MAQHLRAWLDYSDGRRALYYWRTKSGVEVDFWVCGENAFVALEVKNVGKVRSSDLRSLRAFIHDFPEAQALLIYRGQERLLINGIHCIPCEHFLRNMHPGQPLAP